MTVMTSAGTSLAISAGQPATFDHAGFVALSYTPIGEISSIDGDLGRVYELVTWNNLASRATVKKKGTYNSGSLKLQIGIDEDDAGQVLAKAALTSDNNYSFKLTLQDGSVKFFQGVVMSFPITPGNANSITQGTITIEITADDSGNDFVEAAS